MEGQVSILYPSRVKFGDKRMGQLYMSSVIKEYAVKRSELGNYIEVDQFTEVIPEERLKLLEKIFAKYNSEENPLSMHINPAKQELIGKWQSYTSMSIGSIVKIVIKEIEELWVVAGMGFEKL